MGNYDHLRIRQLISPGDFEDICEYPAEEFILSNQYYLIHNETPFIITLFDSQKDETYASEGVILNEHEIIFLIFIRLHEYFFYLGDFFEDNLSALGMTCTTGEELKNNRDILTSIIDKKHFSTYTYKFRKQSFDKYDYFKHPLTTNKIFLRTCFSLIKADMLAISTSNLFFEESCLNTYIALEGVLYLLHDKFYPNQSFNINNIKEIFRCLLDDNDMLYKTLKESHELRNSLVHPEVAADEFDSVFPIYSAEELAVNSQYAFAFLKYILTGDIERLKYDIDPIPYIEKQIRHQK